MRRALSVACVALLWFPLASCDDDDVDEAREDLEDIAGETGARVAAEAMRGLVLRADEGERRSVATLDDAAEDLPGDPDVSGIADTDGDGLDDDGRVTITVEDQTACLVVREDGETEVSSSAC